jgi:Putative Ig domain
MFRFGSMSRRHAVATLAVSCVFATAASTATLAATTTNIAPTISGVPAVTARRGTTYVFQPSAADANGDPLTFMIVNKPGWMWFNTSTGKLTGTPHRAQVGRTFSGIRIKVSDGLATSSLPAFAITVVGSSTTNHAPTISGTPVTSARVGQPYAFRVTASDADADLLTFSVASKPVWASFDATNGTLYGTPTSANLGTYPNIVIRVSDGKATASLAPFTITVTSGTTGSVTLNWAAPTTNTDGTALTDLAGYKVSYGTAPGQYAKTLSLSGAGANTVVVSGLTAGTWYFSIRSYNTAGIVSDFSGEVSVVI